MLLSKIHEFFNQNDNEKMKKNRSKIFQRAFFHSFVLCML